MAGSRAVYLAASTAVQLAAKMAYCSADYWVVHSAVMTAASMADPMVAW